MGKVASDKCHKWVFKEPTESEANISNYWQSSFDALPPEWTDQFESGIQTIAVIQAGHGLLQLGSCKIIPEDLHFVLRMRHTFESIGYQSGFYLSQLFSSNRNSSSPSAIPSNQSPIPIRPPSNLLNWAQRPLPSPSATILLPSSHFHSSKLHLPHLKETRIDDSAGEHENEIKWPNGLSFFNALTGRADDAKLLINPESFGGKLDHHRDEFLSLDSNFESSRRMEGKFGRSFTTMPGRMASASSSTSLDQHQNQTSEFSRNSETGLYNDVMETFLE